MAGMSEDQGAFPIGDYDKLEADRDRLKHDIDIIARRVLRPNDRTKDRFTYSFEDIVRKLDNMNAILRYRKNLVVDEEETIG